MKILVLTSDKQRHLYLVKLLCEKGYTVLAWAEKKGANLNQKSFTGEMKILCHLHDQALNNAFDRYLPQVEKDKLPLKIFDRGVFNGDMLIASAKEFAPDIVIVYGCGIVGRPLLSIFQERMIGSHQGLPQYYRGSGSNFFAFLNKQSSLMGISIHRLDAGIDTGPIIAQRTLEPSVTDTYYTYSAKLVLETINLKINILEQLKDQPLESFLIPLPNRGKLYQRRDFTPEVLLRMLQMQLEKSFYAWYKESLKEIGYPQLIGGA